MKAWTLVTTRGVRAAHGMHKVPNLAATSGADVELAALATYRVLGA